MDANQHYFHENIVNNHFQVNNQKSDEGENMVNHAVFDYSIVNLKQERRRSGTNKDEDYIVSPITEKAENGINADKTSNDSQDQEQKTKQMELKVQDRGNQSSSSCIISCSLWPYENCRMDWFEDDGEAQGGRELEGACLAPFISYGVKEHAYPELVIYWIL